MRQKVFVTTKSNIWRKSLIEWVACEIIAGGSVACFSSERSINKNRNCTQQLHPFFDCSQCFN